MWIKLIVSLVAFGALIQSGLTCPAQCSCWDCSCTDIMYLSTWITQNAGKVIMNSVNNPDSAVCSGTNTCSGTNKPVRSITAAETSPEKCPGYVKPTTTTAMPTTTTPEIIPTTEPVTTAVTPKPTSGVKLNCTGIVQRSDRPGDCGNPACHTLMNCANFMSCLCASCAICQKRR
uniref:Variable lymphocyte receptor B n=1 Tax=Geotria australis TaxID=71168 RepID=A0A8K1T0F5_9VERT|nr:variable lymphocyte receptor B [Geotria australis]